MWRISVSGKFILLALSENVQIFITGVMALLRPLLLDVVPTIQQTAALALGRLANYNDDLAEAVVKADILPQLVYSLAEQNVSQIRYFKKFFLLYNRFILTHSANHLGFMQLKITKRNFAL